MEKRTKHIPLPVVPTYCPAGRVPYSLQQNERATDGLSESHPGEERRQGQLHRGRRRAELLRHARESRDVHIGRQRCGGGEEDDRGDERRRDDP
jgi:hypothetical protein